MSSALVTILITVILVLLAVSGLAIGLLLTGKSKLHRGSCGRIPQKKRDKHCGTDFSCPLCRPEEYPHQTSDKNEE